MFQSREEFSNARQHLHLLQSKVEKSLNALVLQFRLWNGDDDSDTAVEEIVQASLACRTLLAEHFQQVSGDALLERVITQHPSLVPVMNDVEKLQAAILSDLDTLIAELKKKPRNQAMVEKYRDEILRLQSEVLAEGQQERHLMERGWV